MLQRLTRSQVSGQHFWKTLESQYQFPGACQCSSAAAEQPVRQSLERRLKQQVKVDIANLSQPPDPRPIYAGILLERYPVCFPDPAPWRLEHREWSMKWNRWKFRQVTDEQMSADKQSIDAASAEVRLVPCQRYTSNGASDITLIVRTEVQATFKPEPLVTEADRENDIRSLRRCTQGHIYLSCRYGYEDDSKWEIPRTRVHEKETLREAAQRCLREIAGDSIETFIFSNSPSAHADTEDDRTFYMLGVVLDGDVKSTSDSPATDYAWLKRAELAESYKDDQLMSKLVHFLLEE